MPTPEEQAELDEQERLRLEEEENQRGISINDPPPPAWHSVVYEANNNASRERQRAERAERELEELRRPKIVEEPIAEGEPFADPAKFLNRIKKEMDRSVAPVNEFMARQSRAEEYGTLKASLKQGANTEALANFAKLEPLIDEAFRSNPNLPVTLDEITRQITFAVGTLTLRGGYNNPSPPPKITREVIPPNIRPTPSVVRNQPNNNNEPDPNEFDENERRLARENKMTLGEYKIMRDTPDHESAAAWRGILAARKAKGAK